MKKRILVLVEETLVPPSKDEELDPPPWETEFDVVQGLKALGHDVEVLGVKEELAPIRKSLVEQEPHIVFNLLEEFHSQAIFDQNVVSYLELRKQAYTGCNPRGLILARDKALAKKVMLYHRIRTPGFNVFPIGKKVRAGKLRFPVIVKCLDEEASLGLSEASVVRDAQKLEERVKFIHEKFRTAALAETFIEGREMYVGIIGNQRLTTFPIWELFFRKTDAPERHFATSRVKFNLDYQDRLGVETRKAAGLSNELRRKIESTAKRVYRHLGLSGYARIDLRLTAEGDVYVIEANPNPDIAKHEDFARSAKSKNIMYPQLLEKIVNLGISYHASVFGSL